MDVDTEKEKEKKGERTREREKVGVRGGERTMGKISGVLYVTSYRSLPSSVCLMYPLTTSWGTPLSSSAVNVIVPCP